MSLFSSKFKNGFTIIELLITLALFSVVISLIFTILISYNNIFYKTDNDIELQQQGQFIIGFMEEKMIEACEIIYLEDMDGRVKHDTNERVTLKKIIVKNNENRENKGYIFQLSKNSVSNTYNLKYGTGIDGSATVEGGNYIEKIEVEPLPSNRTYREADGINIKLYLNVNGQRKSMKSQLCFRNSHRR